MIATTNRFGSIWDEYAARVLPKHCHAIQKQETRRAFYAGGAALFKVIMSSLSDGTEPTDGDFRALDELRAEFEAFTDDVEGGRA